MNVWEQLNDVGTLNKLVVRIAETASDRRFAYVIGAGVSMVQKMPSWNQYVEDLIDYWKTHLEDLSDSVNAENMFVFEKIKKSSLTNQRKIDLVHQVLKDVTDNDGRLYEESLLKFEKMYFSKMKPVLTQNEVIEKLISIPARFVTTNYDVQLEEHLRRLNAKKVTVSVKDIGQFEDPNLDSLPDIIHMHGRHDSNVEDFINSSMSYMSLYDSENANLEKFKKLYRDAVDTTLFVGSGLEEDHVLAIFDKDSSNYALMKADSNYEDEIEARFRKIQEQMFFENYGIQIIWYGTNFSDLPSFLKYLIERVETLNPKSVINSDYVVLNQQDLKRFQDYIVKAVQTVADQKNVSDWLDTLSGEMLDENAAVEVDWKVHSFLGAITNLETTKILELFPNIWNVLNKWQGDFNLDEQKMLRKFFSESLNIPYEFDLNRINIVGSEEESKIYTHIGTQIEDVEYMDYIHIPSVLGEWLLYNMFLVKTHSDGPSDLNKLEINLSTESVAKLDKKTNSFWLFNNQDTLRANVEYRILLDALRESRITVDGKQLDEADPLIFNWVALQRAMVLVSLEGNLSDRLIRKLVKTIDFSISHFGVEMNEFVDKYSNIIREEGRSPYKGTYVDSINPVEFGAVQEKSIFSREEIENADVAFLIEQLTGADVVTDTDNPFEERSLRATSRSLVMWAKDDTMVPKIKLLIAAMTPGVFEKIKDAVVDMTNPEIISDEGLRKVAFDAYLEHYSQNTFDYSDERFFEMQLNLDHEHMKIISVLDGVEVGNLADDSSFKRKSLLTIDYVVNSDLGRYFWIIRRINTEIDTLKKLNEIANLNTDYFDFFMGAFKNWDESDKPNFQNLIGYSSRFTPSFKMMNVFKNSFTSEELEKFFNSEDFDSTGKQLASRFVAIILLEHYDPYVFNLTGIEMVVNDLKLQSIYGDQQFAFEEKWIEWLSKISKESLYNFIIRNINNSNINKQKIETWMDVVGKTPDASKAKIAGATINYLLRREDEHKEYKLEIISKIIEDGKITFEFMNAPIWVKFLKEFEITKQKKLIEKLVELGQLSPVMKIEIDKALDFD